MSNGGLMMRLYLKLLALTLVAVISHRLIPPALGPLGEAQFAARAFGADYLRTESRQQITAAAVRVLERERARMAAARPDLFPNGPVRFESPPPADIAGVSLGNSSTQERPSHGLRHDRPSSQAVRATDGEIPRDLVAIEAYSGSEKNVLDRTNAEVEALLTATESTSANGSNLRPADLAIRGR